MGLSTGILVGRVGMWESSHFYQGAYPHLSAIERTTREEWVFVGLGTGTVGKFPLHIMQISPF